MFPKYENRDDIPEAFRDAYHEVDNEWVIKPQPLPEGTPTQADLDNIKSTLDKEREAREAAEKQVKEAQAQAKALQQKQAQIKAGLTDDELKELRLAVRQDLVEEFQNEVDIRDKKIQELSGVRDENRSLKLDTRVKQMMLSKEVGVRPDRVDHLFMLLQNEFDLTDDDKPKLTKRPGLTVEQFLKDDAKSLFPEFYIGTRAAGGGAGGVFRTDGTSVSGTGIDDVFNNPKAAMAAARAES